MNDIKELLASHGLRHTAARQAVFETLLGATKPLTIGAIYQHCPHINRTSVYRTIDTFLALHAVTEVPIGWKIHYELAEPFHGHHHHTHCTKCGKTEILESSSLEKLIIDLSRHKHYTHSRHSVEVHGVCRTCSG